MREGLRLCQREAFFNASGGDLIDFAAVREKRVSEREASEMIFWIAQESGVLNVINVMRLGSR